MKLTRPQLIAIENFANKELDGYYTRQQYKASFPFWERSPKGWEFVRQSATGQMRLLMWFQHTQQPGSQEWRPVIIVQAVLEHLGLPYRSTVYGTRETPSAATAGGLKHEFLLVQVDSLPDLTDEERDHQEIQESLIIPYSPPPSNGSNHRRPGQPLLSAFTTCRMERITSPF